MKENKAYKEIQDNEHATYKEWQFNKDATFKRVQFNEGATFEEWQDNQRATFKGMQDNEYATFEGWQDNEGATFKEDLLIKNIVIRDENTELSKAIKEFSKDKDWDECTLTSFFEWVKEQKEVKK